MNYTSITINDQKVGLKFGMASFRYLQSKYERGVAFVSDDINEIGIAHIIYSGYYNNCLVKDVDPELTFEQLVEYIEQNLLNNDFIEEVKRIIELWSNNEFIKKAVEETQQVAKKKTNRGKK